MAKKDAIEALDDALAKRETLYSERFSLTEDLGREAPGSASARELESRLETLEEAILYADEHVADAQARLVEVSEDTDGELRCTVSALASHTPGEVRVLLEHSVHSVLALRGLDREHQRRHRELAQQLMDATNRSQQMRQIISDLEAELQSTRNLHQIEVMCLFDELSRFEGSDTAGKAGAGAAAAPGAAPSTTPSGAIAAGGSGGGGGEANPSANLELRMRTDTLKANVVSALTSAAAAAVNDADGSAMELDDHHQRQEKVKKSATRKSVSSADKSVGNVVAAPPTRKAPQAPATARPAAASAAAAAASAAEAKTVAQQKQQQEVHQQQVQQQQVQQQRSVRPATAPAQAAPRARGDDADSIPTAVVTVEEMRQRAREREAVAGAGAFGDAGDGDAAAAAAGSAPLEKENARRQPQDPNVFSRLHKVAGKADKNTVAAPEPVRDHEEITDAEPCVAVIKAYDIILDMCNARNPVHLFCGSADKTVKLWDIREMKLMSTLAGHDRRVSVVVSNVRDTHGHHHYGGGGGGVAAGQALLFSGSSDNTVRVWSAGSGGEAVATLDADANVNSLAVHGARLYAGLEDGSMRVWDMATWSVVETVRASRSSIFSMCATSAGKIVAGCRDGSMHEFDAATLDRRAFTTEKHLSGVTRLSEYREGGESYVISVSRDKSVRAYTAGGALVTYDKRAHRDGINTLKLHGNTLFTASTDKSIIRWSLRDLVDPTRPFASRRLGCMLGHTDSVESMCVVQDVLVSGSKDKFMKLWRV